MNYYNSRILNVSFIEAVNKVMEELSKEGFGVLSDIDLKETLKKKLNVDFRKYRILGACNPPLAYRALQSEENIGVMLPCNVIVHEKADGIIQVSAINPMEAMKSVKNAKLNEVAEEVSMKLKKVLDTL